MIDISSLLTHENGIGFELNLKNNKKLAILSIYTVCCKSLEIGYFIYLKLFICCILRKIECKRKKIKALIFRIFFSLQFDI